MHIKSCLLYIIPAKYCHKGTPPPSPPLHTHTHTPKPPKYTQQNQQNFTTHHAKMAFTLLQDYKHTYLHQSVLKCTSMFKHFTLNLFTLVLRNI